MIIDLRKGFGDFPEYKLFKFPDNSIKFQLKSTLNSRDTELVVITSLRTNDDLIVLGLIKDVLDRLYQKTTKILLIKYMMYQQDDRRFSLHESFGLKVISNFINNLNFDKISIFHPHSDKVEFINNCSIYENMEFIRWFLSHSNPNINHRNNIWVIPDAGAFKTQFKQLPLHNVEDFITCMKSRNHITGEIETVVNTDDLQGKDCFIVDDICLGGNTFIQITKKLKEKNCGKLYLAVSHGIFNNGIEHLLEHFEYIATTDSICTLPESEKLKIYKL